MDLSSVIRVIRRKISEVDPATQTLQDGDIATYAGDALSYLRTMLVRGFDTTVVIGVGDDTTPSAFANTAGVATELDEALAMILAYRTAVDILKDEFKGRIRRGEMGVSWKSGLEEESSSRATQAYEAFILEVETELQALILTQRVKFTAQRMA